ncbi:hypothetical protein JCM31826_03130 [Thermaurantimonas aggregans]|uniref:Uncharacterized protein n=1 Tax=Thermaurantimonas aggregans TaxID=2173829 RepID=A0A401XIL0_9FLAO|nr:hypothetical protein JCM31826_03130 [Thermaurantimonas aggregans]
MIFNSCTLEEDSRAKVELKVGRFEQDFFKLSPENVFDSLPKLKKIYAPFFTNTDDEFWRNILKDSVHLRLYAHVRDSFKYINKEIEQIVPVLERYKYHFNPPFEKFYLFTYVSRLDYDYPVIFSDSLLFIALDLYLGEEHPAYGNQPRYLAREHDRKFIPIDVAYAISESLIIEQKQTSETLLSHMIREGIKLYITRKLLPEEKEYNIFKYTKEQLDFCEENERNIWLYFVNNKLLFDVNYMTKKNFIDPAPFTKLGTEFDNQIPGRLGRWIGYKIVSQYMRKNKNISLKDLIKSTDYHSIFYQANYKP